MPIAETLTSDTRPAYAHPAAEPEQAGLALVQQALERLRYGSIQLTVHDGRLVQIDVTERTRFPGRG